MELVFIGKSILRIMSEYHRKISFHEGKMFNTAMERKTRILISWK
jgi:hypothetical protein